MFKDSSVSVCLLETRVKEKAAWRVILILERGDVTGMARSRASPQGCDRAVGKRRGRSLQGGVQRLGTGEECEEELVVFLFLSL